MWWEVGKENFILEQTARDTSCYLGPAACPIGDIVLIRVCVNGSSEFQGVPDVWP